MTSEQTVQVTLVRQLMDAVSQHVSILEPDWTDTFTNRSASEYHGLFPTASPKDLIATITHPEDLDGLLSNYQHAIATGAAVETDARVRRQDGMYRWFHHRFFPLQDEEGRIVRWCGVRVDIDNQKQPEERSHRENIALRDEIDTASMFEEIVGTSQPLRAVMARVLKAARTDSTVLITGETGTGKELIARAIHKKSERAGRAFVSVNCASIPRDLIASELFGHEKGAFTGALQRRLGRFELAEGGTIFLDEIGELSAEMQVALLRVLQEREFQRVGGNLSIRADVRVIAATHRDLPGAIADGTFRSDLFYRINVFPVELPPLRERKEDIHLLIEYFIDRYASKAGKKIRRIEKKSLDLLRSYPWPGNIRELQNVVERSVILCDSETFSVDESWLSHQGRSSRPLPDEIHAQERVAIEAALTTTRGRISGPAGAAAQLGMPPSTLDSKIKVLKINKRDFQAA